MDNKFSEMDNEKRKTDKDKSNMDIKIFQTDKNHNQKAP